MEIASFTEKKLDLRGNVTVISEDFNYEENRKPISILSIKLSSSCMFIKRMPSYVVNTSHEVTLQSR